MKTKSRTLVRALIQNAWNDKILLIKRASNERTAPGLWEFPQGKRDACETAEQSLMREIAEEIGWKEVDDFPQYLSSDTFMIEKPGVVEDWLHLNYGIVIAGYPNVPAIELSADHDSYTWAKRADVVGLLGDHPYNAAAVRLAKQML